MLNEAAPSDRVIALKSLETFAQVADGRATKIIIPSDIQNMAGLATSLKELFVDGNVDQSPKNKPVSSTASGRAIPSTGAATATVPQTPAVPAVPAPSRSTSPLPPMQSVTSGRTSPLPPLSGADIGRTGSFGTGFANG